MDKIKTLSAAIRYGSKLKPQSFVALFMVHRLTGQVHSCALGAAYDAVRLAKGDSIELKANFGLSTGFVADKLKERFGSSLDKLMPVPEMTSNSADARFIVPYLNDRPNHQLCPDCEDDVDEPVAPPKAKDTDSNDNGGPDE